MSTICWRLLRKNAVLALATSLRYHSSDEDASTPCYTSHSSQKQNGSAALCLDASRLEVLNVNFDSQWVPSSLDVEDEDGYQEFFQQGQVYLIGVSHRDEDCVADVRRAIQWIRPDGVMVELCTHREDHLHDDDDDDQCEFRAAFEECDNLPDCYFVRGDRCHRTTDKRAWNVIGADEIFRIAKDIVRLMLGGEARHVLDAVSHIFTCKFKKVHDDEAEQRAYEVSVNQLIAEVFPEWWKANMTERDLYMTHVLDDGLERLTQEKYLAAGPGGPEPVRIVAVVGEDHVDGIRANWGKVDWVDEEVIKELWRYITKGRERQLVKDK
ncbi:TraB family protein [Aphelenchoides avenae]|nr:TraB family protein [Aphelenchus avenae]